MSDERLDRAKEIQQMIREILMKDWDPIGVAHVPEAKDEYDSYIGGVYRLLASKATENQIADYLANIETGAMGLSAPGRESLLPVASKPIALNVSL